MDRAESTGSGVALGQREAVDLATAWVAHRAERMGVRLLVLKGPIAHEQRLRGEKLSADVDVLIEPGMIGRLAAEVESAGWRERFAPDIPRLLELHSLTLIHDQWPIDLDLHHYWPGFLGDRAQVFDELWAARSAHSIAAVTVFAPDRVSNALVLALHALRRPAEERRLGELPSLVEAVEREQISVADIVARARLLGAMQTARPFLQQLGVAVAPDEGPSDELRLWNLNASSKGHTRAWLLAVMAAPWYRKPTVVFRAAIPRPAELRGLHPELKPGWRGLVRGWTGRIFNGVKEVPRAAAEVVQFSATGRKGAHDNDE